MLASLLIFGAFVQVKGFGFGGGGGEALYGPQDKAITILEQSNFSHVVLGSDTAWMVEFYSSWCGHCIRFAPVFKELSTVVAGWSDIIRLGAIDCAQEVNMPTCRDFEVMGYPSLKFFGPRASQAELGELRHTMSKEIPSMTEDMARFLLKVENNKTFSHHIAKQKWPQLNPYCGQELQEVWSLDDEEHSLAVFLIEPEDSMLGVETILNIFSAAKKHTAIIRRVVPDDAGSRLLKELGYDHGQNPYMVLAVRRTDSLSTVLFKSTSGPKVEDLSKSVLDFLGDATFKWKEAAPVITSSKEVGGDVLSDGGGGDTKRRRYTTYMSDLENAILYSLSHEVGQHAAITGQALVALQEYVHVLADNFPGRRSTMAFLSNLRDWMLSHDDAVRGEDISKKIRELREETGSFDDTPGGIWMGCKGSKPLYGGYPCGLWTLWHVLTVNQMDPNPKRPLLAMVGYIKHFFGCRECARHFLLEVDDGNNVAKEVTDSDKAALILWRVHNKANVRLSGDITDDQAFPKAVFPDKIHCPDCYDSRLMGSDLWSEFRHDRILRFLKELYGKDKLSFEGLRVGLQVHNRSVSVYKLKPTTAWTLFSPMDLSLCLSIYVLSAVILIVVYVKFIAKRKCSSAFSGLLFGRRRTINMGGIV